MKKRAFLGTALIGAALFSYGGYGCGSSDSDVTTPDTTDGGGDDGSIGNTDPDAAKGPTTCGNGKVEGTEECDKGAGNAPGSGCEHDCSFTCIAGEKGRGDDHCDDSNACTGSETCGADHICKAGTPLASGATCATGKVCNGGNCVAMTCGDGIVTAPEECDDGNAKDGDGCDGTCKFSCLSTDTTRNCTPADLCEGQGTCNDTTHVCTKGTPLGDGAGCGAAGGDGGAGSVCKGGVCVTAACGDGVLETGEQCDFGTGNGSGTGCELNCKFSCSKSPESCTTADLCAGTSACTTVTVGSASGQKCVVGTPPIDGTTCGNGGKCAGHVCVTATCGNGTLEAGEQCDFGTGANLAGSGCEPDCLFSCTITPTDSCPSSDLCSASPQKCGVVKGANNTNGQKCAAATAIAACGACTSGGTAGVCVSNKCQVAKCGDTCVTGPGETCDPPGTATCDAQCHTIACGDGVRAGTEQCDDHNKTNLDGCDSVCNFEQDHRANSVALKYAGDTTCKNDALGGAIGAAAQGTVTSGLTSGVNDGTTTIAFKFLGITDLSGTAQASGLQLGSVGGVPATSAGKTYDGSKDLDWWYTTDPGTYDAARTPISKMTASLNKKVLTATGTIDVGVVLAGTLAKLHLSGTTITANVGNTSAPTASTGASPGHLTSENLDSTLKTFDAMTGTLCGNISGASLATVPMPLTLLNDPNAKCDQAYTASNHLLDVLVNGCTHSVIGIPFSVIASTQPDQIDANAPAVGGGAPYTLTSTGLTVTGCKGKNGTALTGADFQACLNAAAYSSYFGFTTDRVIMK